MTAVLKEVEIKAEIYPLVKWVGGKRQLMSDLLRNLPLHYNRYLEPFVGGGALFFTLQQENSYISDMNEELINLYQVVRDNVEELIKDLHTHENNKDYYLKIRDLDRLDNYGNISAIKRASRFIYLNRTCFNGLYRVNSKGEFNVPFGKYKNPKLVDEVNLVNVSRLLQATEIKHADFKRVLDVAKVNDFVYFDPPYMPLNETSSFTSYTKDGFGIDKQIELKNVCDELHSKGVKFMLSNSDTQFIKDLYADYEINTVYASRQVNSKASGRGKITEVLIKNYR